MTRVPTRIMVFFSAWVAEVLRQPSLMLSLVVGPFVVLLAFGTSVQLGGSRPKVSIVRPEVVAADESLPSIEEVVEGPVRIVAEGPDLEAALAQLHRGDVDVVVEVPPDPIGFLERGQSIPLNVYIAESDPVKRSYADAFLVDALSTLNRQTIERVLDTAREPLTLALSSSGQTTAARELRDVPPSVVSSPFVLQIQEAEAFTPDFTQYYAPAVLALLIQHLGITLGAFSITRMRRLGLTDLLRVAPVRVSEVLIGHYLAYAALIALVGGLLLAAVMFALDVPMLGEWPLFVGLLAAFVLTSLGVGFVISLVSSSEQQAVQLAMLILLASIFFGGMAFTLDRIAWPARGISFGLPATYAIRSLQDVMLRGETRHAQDLIVLGGAAAVLFVLTFVLLRREFRPS